MTVTSPLEVCFVMTCHNRRSKSVAVVQALHAAAQGRFTYRIVAVDDGSTDGTGEALRALDVDVRTGDGSLYWAGGMAMALDASLEYEPAFVCMLNDDLVLNPAVIDDVSACVRSSTGCRTAFVGAVLDPTSFELNYGIKSQNPKNPVSFRTLEPVALRDAANNKLTFNANFVLLSREAFQEMEFPGRKYRHAYADLHFGLALSRAGYSIEYFPNKAGWTSSNPRDGRMFDSRLSLKERWSYARSPHGLPPIDQWRFCNFVCRGGVGAVLAFLNSYRRVLWPRPID